MRMIEFLATLLLLKSVLIEIDKLLSSNYEHLRIATLRLLNFKESPELRSMCLAYYRRNVLCEPEDMKGCLGAPNWILWYNKILMAHRLYLSLLTRHGSPGTFV